MIKTCSFYSKNTMNKMSMPYPSISSLNPITTTSMSISLATIASPFPCTNSVSSPSSCIISNNRPEHASPFLSLVGIFMYSFSTTTPSTP